MEGWMIAGIAILSVLGSVAWVRPSQRDVKLAQWRRDAIVAGLHVKLEALKAEPKDSGIREDVAGVSYFLYQPKPIKGDKETWAVVKTDGWLQEGLPQQWSWYRRQNNKKAMEVSVLINDAPVKILALERTPVLSRIMWAETGDAFDAVALNAFLQKVQDTF